MNRKKFTKKRHLWFLCNSCLAIRRTSLTSDLREGLVCPSCGLNSRQRAVLLAAQRNAKKAFLLRKNLKIIGVSDGAPIESAFRDRFGKAYENFEFHTEPFLDITKVQDVPDSFADVVTCSEVLEHVQPPVELAFSGLYKLLKPGGLLILSVPHTGVNSMHVEHFPVMQNSKLIFEPVPVLRGIDLQGNERKFSQLFFHGGAGATLEYRVFSETSLKENLEKAGFIKNQAQGDNRLFGCIWEPWSRVWIAKKPN